VGAWCRLAVFVRPEHGELTSSLLFELGAGGLEEVAHGELVELRAYGSEVEVEDLRQAFQRLAAVRGALAYVEDSRVQGVSDEWQHAWADGLEAVQVTPELVVAPEGLREARDGVLVLERSLAFGFGEHPTTRMAIRRMVSGGVAGARILDFGTGGGLLALVADRYGAESALGLDIDPLAIEAARRNAQMNGARACEFSTGSLDEFPGPYDLVVANVDVATLLRYGDALADRLAIGGRVLVTGFLTDDRSALVAAFARGELVQTFEDIEGDWLLLEFRRGG
jgi:ribosomal protein L11 methyltransferase